MRLCGLAPWLAALALVTGALAGCPGRAVPPPAPVARPTPPPAAPPPLLAQLEAARDLDGVPVGASAAPATVVVVFASWCGHCQRALAMLDELRATYPGARVLGLSYRGHEEYAQRGSRDAVRAYAAAHAPWLRVVPAGEALFAALGRPAMVPTILVLDAAGARVATYDRRARPVPSAEELAGVLAALGAGR